MHIICTTNRVCATTHLTWWCTRCDAPSESELKYACVRTHLCTLVGMATAANVTREVCCNAWSDRIIVICTPTIAGVICQFPCNCYDICVCNACAHSPRDLPARVSHSRLYVNARLCAPISGSFWRSSSAPPYVTALLHPRHRFVADLIKI